MREVQISIEGQGLTEEQLQEKAQLLAREIEKRSDTRTSGVRVKGDGQTKGDPITLGAFLITFMTSGAAVAAFNVVKAWIERDEIGSATIKKPDGTEITVTKTSIEQVDSLLATLDHNGK